MLLSTGGLTPPSSWGKNGCHMIVGEGQGLARLTCRFPAVPGLRKAQARAETQFADYDSIGALQALRQPIGPEKYQLAFCQAIPGKIAIAIGIVVWRIVVPRKLWRLESHLTL